MDIIQIGLGNGERWRGAARLLGAARRVGRRAVIMAGAPPAHAQIMARLLRAGRIGTVTHVSCVDRRARGVEG